MVLSTLQAKLAKKRLQGTKIIKRMEIQKNS
jgi:hypothetical protein